MLEDRHRRPGTLAGSISTEGRGHARRAVERRMRARFPVSASVEAVEVQSKARIVGRTSDLGLGGCYVDTISPFPIGAIMKMRLTYESKAFETRAKVVVSSVGMGMGVMFLEPEPDQLRTLEGWIHELSGESHPEPDLPEINVQPSVEAAMGGAQSSALQDLVIELMRTGALSESMGRVIIQKLHAATAGKK